MRCNGSEMAQPDGFNAQTELEGLVERARQGAHIAGCRLVALAQPPEQRRHDQKAVGMAQAHRLQADPAKFAHQFRFGVAMFGLNATVLCAAQPIVSRQTQQQPTARFELDQIVKRHRLGSDLVEIPTLPRPHAPVFECRQQREAAQQQHRPQHATDAQHGAAHACDQLLGGECWGPAHFLRLTV